MNNIKKELPSLIASLLKPSSYEELRATIEQHFTEGCRLTHALVMARNRKEILHVFQYWTFVNAHLEAEIHDIFVDKDEDKAVVIFTQKVSNFLHTPVSFNLSMSTLLYFDTLSDGRKVISKQVDHHSFESIVFNMPLLGWFLTDIFRRLSSFFIIQSARGVGHVSIPHGLAIDRYVQLVSKIWWKEAKDTIMNGRIVAPYEPFL